MKRRIGLSGCSGALSGRSGRPQSMSGPGNRQKRHEEFLRGTLSELKAAAAGLKGEMVLVVEGCGQESQPALDMAQITDQINERIRSGMSAADAIRQFAKESGVSKNEIYRAYHQES